MTGRGTPDPETTGRARTGSRLLGVAVVGLLLAAVALWAASRGTWLTAVWDVPLRGRVEVTATGADTEPVLVPWALLALAAVGGLLATSGWGRRVVGAVLGGAGLWALLRSVAGLAAPAPDAVPAAARQAGRAAGVSVSVLWPSIGALGGLLLVAVGALVALRGAAMPRLGARYDAPGAARRSAGTPADPERGLWDALDAGEDPTAAPEQAPDPTPGSSPGGSTVGPRAAEGARSDGS